MERAEAHRTLNFRNRRTEDSIPIGLLYQGRFGEMESSVRVPAEQGLRVRIV